MALVAITAVGEDRPGIVAGFSGALFRLGCNLEETTMTRLRDEFAMLLLVRLPAGATAAALQAALAEVADELQLSLVLRAVPEPHAPGALRAAPGAAAAVSSTAGYLLSVYGADRPGIVHAATALLAARGLNISDLNTRVIPGSGGPVYVMLLEVDVPSPEAAEALRPDLERLSRELEVDIAWTQLETEAL